MRHIEDLLEQLSSANDGPLEKLGPRGMRGGRARNHCAIDSCPPQALRKT
jgi:hypothetical protein